MTITRAEAQNMADAHADGSHTPPEGLPREGCPDCDDRDLSSYPPFAKNERVRERKGGLAVVVRCKRDRYGWDVLVQPEWLGEQVWIGAGQLERVA